MVEEENSDELCEICHKPTTKSRPKKGAKAYPKWYYIDGKRICTTCNARIKYQRKNAEKWANMECCRCHSKETGKTKHGAPRWIKKPDGYVCTSCHTTEVNQTREITPEMRENFSKWQRGKKLTDEHKEKLSQANTGENNPMYGKHLTPEQIEKMLKNKVYPTGEDHPNFGKEMPQEQRTKISETRKSLNLKHTEEWKDKMSIRLAGENNPAWDNGVTELVRAIRATGKYLSWRGKVIEKDNYRCVMCGSEENLEAHHIVKTFKQLIKAGNVTITKQALEDSEFWDVAYGVSVCAPCHTIADKMLGSAYSKGW